MNKAYIKLPHIILEVLSFVNIIASIIVIAIFSGTVDGEIATHFDFYGNPDGYSEPISIIVLPIIFLITDGMLSLMAHFYPVSSWNMPCKVTEKSAPYIYRTAITIFFLLIFEFSLMSLAFTLSIFFAPKAMGVLVTLMVGLMLITSVFLVVKTIVDSKKYA